MQEHSEYGKIYSEISKGFSQAEINNQIIYFKHPTIAEHFENYASYDLLAKIGKSKGLSSESEIIDEAINGGWWSRQKESQISLLEKTISNLIKTKEKLQFLSQKKDIDSQILKNKAILMSYNKERRDIISYSLEDFINNRLTEQLLIFFTYQDCECKNKFFKDIKDYYENNEDIIEKIKNTYFNYSSFLNERNIKMTASCGFFQNLIYLSESSYEFWGRPTVQCSKYQIDLLLYGKMYKQIIKNYAEDGKPINEEVLYNPEKFVDWVENKQGGNTVKNQKTDKSNAVSSYVGATREDLKELGVKVEKIKGKSLLQMVEEKGGTLEKSDYLNARINN